MFSKIKLYLKVNHSKIDWKLKIENCKLLLLLAFLVPCSLSLFPDVAHAAMVVNSSGVSNNLKSGLVGWWTFDGGDMTGTSIFDKAGANPLTISTLSKVSGKIGQGTSYNGTSDYASKSGITTLDTGTSNFSISAWINIKGSGTTGSNGASAFFLSNGTANPRIFIRAEGALLSGQFYDGTNGANAQKADMTLNKWAHFVFLRNGGNAQLYVNGVLVSTNSSTFGTPANANLTSLSLLKFGSTNVGTAGYYQGVLDDVRIYNRALSPNEVYSLYQYGNAKINVNSGGVAKDKLKNGLVGWWTFDGGYMSATAVYDKSASAITGAVTGGITRSAGKVGQGITGDGSSGYINLGNASNLKNTDMTFGGWFRYTSPTKATRMLYAKGNTGDYSYGLITTATGVGCRAWIADGNGYYETNFTYSYNDNKWHHYMCSIDEGVAMKEYIDGVMVAQDTTSSGTWNKNGNVNTLIGQRGDLQTAYAWQGGIDDIRHYNTALTANEVYSLYQYGNAKINVSSQAVANQGTRSGLVGHWTFNGGDCGATWCVDKSGNNKTGTLTGTKKVSGKIGQGLRFNGTTDRIAVGGTTDFAIGAGNFTISAWVRNVRITNANNIGIIFDKDGSAATNKYYRFIINNTRTVTLNIRSGATDRSVTTASPFLVSNNSTWSHVVAQRNGTTLNIYLDGKLAVTGTNAANNVNPDNTDTGAMIGDLSRDFPVTQFGGDMDDVRFYNTSLSADEVYSLYLEGK